MSARLTSTPDRELGLRAISERFGSNATSNADIVGHHAHDESFHLPARPDLVVYAQSTEDVADCVRLCAQYRIPVIPFGVGTSLEGHVNAVYGGVSLDMSRMNRLLRLSVEDLDCTVEAGILRQQLDKELVTHGLFFPVDPGANCTIGGMASTGASGTTTVRYGAMRELVMSMRVVIPDGSIVETGRRSRKSSAGYDLTHLFLGSEGTLGVITELTLRLFGIPEATAAATVQFNDLHAAVEAVISIIQLGIGVARIELLDDSAVAAVNTYSGLKLPNQHMLLLEFHGSAEVVHHESQMAGVVLAEHGGSNFTSTTDQAERSALWRARHDAAWAIRAQRAGAQIFVTDVCVPISRLADCIVATRKDIEESSINGPIIGHVGDGNFHVVAVVNPEDAEEMHRVERFNERLISRSIEMGGTCTGEHGVGMGKIDYLTRELGPEAVSLMHTIKTSLDPLGIMNPGKVISSD
ncbi:MAG: FAD-binding oxidoreductase [Actinomycetota bacterium]